MSRMMRLVAASVILSPLYFAPVTVVQSSDGLASVEFSNVCAFGSCAPKPGWKCLHWFPGETVIIDDFCDPNDAGCLPSQT